MGDHEIEITQAKDTATGEVRVFAVCSCGRWRSNPYKSYTDADEAGDAHRVRGDEHNRALAQFNRGVSRLTTELKWYREQADNPLNSERDREMWQNLADELAARIEGEGRWEDQPLW